MKHEEVRDKIRVVERKLYRRVVDELENSFIGDNDGKTIIIKDTSGSRVTAPSAKFVHDDDIPPAPGTHDMAVFKRLTTADKKCFLSTVLEAESQAANGPFSKDPLEVRLDKGGADFDRRPQVGAGIRAKRQVNRSQRGLKRNIPTDTKRGDLQGATGRRYQQVGEDKGVVQGELARGKRVVSERAGRPHHDCRRWSQDCSCKRGTSDRIDCLGSQGCHKKLGACAIPLASFVYWMLNGGVAALSWLLKNLWVVVLIAVAIAYYYSKRRN